MSNRVNKPDSQADIDLRKCLSNRQSFIMTAGAGSGKTTSLVKALSFIEKTEGNILKRNRQKVACITYTTVAESEIWKDVGEDPLFHVSTIHSFLWDLIKPLQNDVKLWVKKRIGNKLAELKDKQAGFGTRVQQKTKIEMQQNIDRYESILSNIDSVNRFSYEVSSNYLNGVLGHDDIIKMVPELIDETPLLRTIVANKYPFFFVDESQDTVPEFIKSLKSIEEQNPSRFCLGFFGDPMQKIYTSGIGKIEPLSGWAEIKKPENYRCSETVLSVINNIRKLGDQLQQTPGKKETAIGSAFLFVLPITSEKHEYIEKVKKYLSQRLSDELWLGNRPEANLKILVIAHRMAAARLGYSDLFGAFNDKSSESFKEGFKKGSHWLVRPFLETILPLIQAYKSRNQFEIINSLRQSSPLLLKISRGSADGKKLKTILNNLENSVKSLYEQFNKQETKVSEVLSFCVKNGMLELDERLTGFLNPIDANQNAQRSELDEEQINSIENYLKVPAIQFLGYQKYLKDESPFDTHQGIKGAEFDRVMVILDDEEGRHNQFSYEKLLNIKVPSDTDLENISNGNDSVFDRTRRLFYVCCSRALKDLAVLLYVVDPDSALQEIKKTQVFKDESIKMLKDL